MGLIVEVKQVMSVELSHYDILTWYPLSLSRMAVMNMAEILKKSGHNLLEWFAYDKFESQHKIIAAKSQGLEYWD